VDILTSRQADRQAGCLVDLYTSKNVDKWTDEQADIQIYRVEIMTNKTELRSTLQTFVCEKNLVSKNNRRFMKRGMKNSGHGPRSKISSGIFFE
jgi:hypothetical protein